MLSFMQSKIQEREKIEQILFEPQLGIVKREVHFGIIDYFQTYTLKKKLESTLKGAIAKNPSSVKPEVYADRFVKTMQKVFQ